MLCHRFAWKEHSHHLASSSVKIVQKDIVVLWMVYLHSNFVSMELIRTKQSRLHVFNVQLASCAPVLMLIQCHVLQENTVCLEWWNVLTVLLDIGNTKFVLINSVLVIGEDKKDWWQRYWLCKQTTAKNLLSSLQVGQRHDSNYIDGWSKQPLGCVLIWKILQNKINEPVLC